MTNKHPFYEHGFWWWYDSERKDWFVGCSPCIGVPTWWKWDRPKILKGVRL